jgi:hypothetical protein
MDLHVNPRDNLIRVFCDGQLKGEIVLGNLHSERDMQKEITLARHYRVEHCLIGQVISRIAQGGVGLKEYMSGFVSGINGESQQHPLPGVPDIAPSYERHFHQGWEDGAQLRELHRAAVVNVSDEIRA